MAIEQLTCPNCGGQMTLIQGGTKAHCESCDTVAVVNKAKNDNSAIADKANIIGVMELQISEIDMHYHLVKEFMNSPYIPLDLFSTTQVLSFEKYCVSGFQFECDYSASYTCQVGNEKTVVRQDDKNSFKEKVTDWTNTNGSISGNEFYFGSGVKEIEESVDAVWWDGSIRNLVEIESASYEADDITYLPYSLSANVAFEGNIKPIVLQAAEDKVIEQLSTTKVRNINIADPRIKNTASRVLLSTVKVDYFYQGKELQLWIAGDGHRSYAKDLPVDALRQEQYDALSYEASKRKPIITTILAVIVALVALFSLDEGGIMFAVLFIALAYIAWATLKIRKVGAAQKSFAAFDQMRLDVIDNYLENQKYLSGCLQAAAAASPEEANPARA